MSRELTATRKYVAGQDANLLKVSWKPGMARVLLLYPYRNDAWGLNK